MKLLIAEDDMDLAEALAAFFKKNNFTVDCVHDGFSAYDYATANDYDAIILDVMMPKMDGFSVLEKLREDGNSKQIMMLTARGEKDDRINGFNKGADDYLPKPFATDELLDRVNAMLRRSVPYQSAKISCGDLDLNVNDGKLTCGDKSAYLSAKEIQICELFMRSPGVVFSADSILQRVWSWDSEVDVNVVWVNISNIRKHLKYLHSTVSLKTTRGIGYVMEPKSVD